MKDRYDSFPIASMAAAEFINDYPRRKFGGRSSNEVHAALLASA